MDIIQHMPGNMCTQHLTYTYGITKCSNDERFNNPHASSIYAETRGKQSVRINET